MEHSKTWNMRKILKRGMRGMSFKKRISILREKSSPLGGMFPRFRFVPLGLCRNITGALYHTQRRKNGERRW